MIDKLRTMKNMNKGTGQENKEMLAYSGYGNFFELHIKGQLDASWSDWLEGLELKPMDNGEMMLHGYIRDQAELMGILNKLYRLNLSLLSVREVKQSK
jgi:hypothetical protein